MEKLGFDRDWRFRLGDTPGGIWQDSLDDADWSVQEQLAASFGELPVGPRETAIVSLLEKHGDDPVVMDAALSGVRGAEVPALAKLLQATIDRLDGYQYMADFGTCATRWPLQEEWEKDILAGKMPDL